MKKTLLFLLVSLLCKLSFAQKGVINYSFNNYTTEQGLPDNYINDIIQDSRGFMWFATGEGLSRFDGTTFKNFFASKSNRLSGNNLAFLEEYKKNNLVFCCSGKLFCMNLVTEQLYQPKQFAGKNIYVIYQATTGNYCLGGLDTCFIVNSNLEIVESIVPPQAFRDKVMRGRLMDSETLMIDNGINYYIYNTSNKRFFSLNQKLGFDSLKSNGALLYIDTKRKLLYFNSIWEPFFCTDFEGNMKKKWIVAPQPVGLSSGDVRCIASKDDSTLWIGTNHGMNILNNNSLLTSQIFSNTGRTNSLISNEVRSVYQDADKNMWIGTKFGVSKINGNNPSIKSWSTEFKDLSEDYGLMNMTKGTDNNIYICQYNGESYKINILTDKVSLLQNVIAPLAWSLHNDGDYIYKTGSGNSIMRYNTKTNEYSQLDFLKPYLPNVELVVMGFKHSNGDE